MNQIVELHPVLGRYAIRASLWRLNISGKGEVVLVGIATLSPLGGAIEVGPNYDRAFSVWNYRSCSGLPTRAINVASRCVGGFLV